MEEVNVVLDVSTYPYLCSCLRALEEGSGKAKVVYYIPDTLWKILQEEENSRTLYEILCRWGFSEKEKMAELLELERLCTRTYGGMDRFLAFIITTKKFKNVEFKLITKKIVDKSLYEKIYRHVVRQLRVKSKKIRELIGDIVAKIISGAKNLKAVILMTNKYLLKVVKGCIGVFEMMLSVEGMKELLRKKEEILKGIGEAIPLVGTLLKERAVRWIISVLIDVSQFFHHLLPTHPHLACLAPLASFLANHLHMAVVVLDP